MQNILKRLRNRNLVPPSEYAWIIDHDEWSRNKPLPDATGVVGPSNAPDSLVDLLAQGDGSHFHMMSMDGVLRYSGRIIGEYDGDEPLNDFGTPNAGAIDIQFVQAHMTVNG